MEILFVYGTLKYPKIQVKLLGREIDGLKDVLQSYKKTRIKIEGKFYTIIVKNKGSSVDGLLINVSKRELKILDEYEGSTYRRKKVVLKSKKKAWFYEKN